MECIVELSRIPAVSCVHGTLTSRIRPSDGRCHVGSVAIHRSQTMRYELRAVVHPVRRLAEATLRPSHRLVSAVVERTTGMAPKRVVAVIDAVRPFPVGELAQVAGLIAARLRDAFARQGLALGEAELVDEDAGWDTQPTAPPQ